MTAVPGQLDLLEMVATVSSSPGRCVCWRGKAWRHARLLMVTTAGHQSVGEQLPVFRGGPGGPEQWDAWTSMCDIRSAMSLTTDAVPDERGLADTGPADWRACSSRDCPGGGR